MRYNTIRVSGDRGSIAAASLTLRDQDPDERTSSIGESSTRSDGFERDP